MKCPACGYDPNGTVIASYQITLDNTPWPSQNELKANTRYANKYRRIREKFTRDLERAGRGIPRATGHRRLYALRAYGKRKRHFDYGNLVGGGKPILDALVSVGLLLNDNPTNLTDYYKQMKSPSGDDHIILVLEDVEKEG